MVTAILFVIAALWLLVGFLVGMRRSPIKAVYCLGVNLIGVALAVLAAFLLSGPITKLAFDLLPIPEDLHAYTELLALARAMVQMGVGVVLYLVGFYPILWIVRGIGGLVARKALPEQIQAKVKFNIGGAGIGVLCSFLVMCAFLTPFSQMLGLADSALSAVQVDAPTYNMIVSEYLTPAAQHPVMQAVRFLGGPTVYAPISSVKVGDLRTDLRREQRSVERMIASAATVVSAGELKSWEDEQIDALVDLVDAVGDSRLISVTATTFLHAASDSWIAGEPFLTVSRPDLGELMNPTANLILEQSSDMKPEDFSATLHTLSGMIDIFHRHGVLRVLGGDAQGDLLKAVANEEMLREFILCISSDRTLGIALPELMNICLRALSEQLGIRADVSSVYTEVVGALTNAIAGSVGAPKGERLATLTDSIYGISQRYGLQLTPVGAYYLSACISEDMQGEISTETVSDWFATYANTAQGMRAGMVSANFGGAYPISIAEFNKGGVRHAVYGMSDGSILLDRAGECRLFYTVQAWSAFLPDVTLRIGSEQGSGVLTDCSSTTSDFRLLTSPRLLTASEAAKANASYPAGAKQAAALEQIAQILADGEDYVLPECIRTSLEQTGKKNGIASALPTEPVSADEFMTYLRADALQEGFSTGSLQAMQSADTLRTNRVTLDRLLLNSRAIAQALPDLDRDGIATAMSGVLTGVVSLLGTEGEGEDPTMNEQTLDSALEILSGVQTAFDSLRVDSADRPSLVGGILQSDSVADLIKVDGDALAGLSDILGADSDSSGEVIGDLVNTITALQVADEGTPEEIEENLSNLLHSITPTGAKAISEVMKPAVLTGLNLSSAAATGVSELVSEVFDRLAVKKEESTSEEFDAECDGLQVLLEIAVTKRETIKENPDSIFGEEGIIGMSADQLLQTVMHSEVISDSLLTIASDSTRSQAFTLSDTAQTVFDLPNLDEGNKQILRDAVDTYWKENSAALPEAESANELAVVTGGEMTKTDLARRLASISAIFGVEYENEHLDLAQSAIIRTVTVTDGEGTLTFSCLQNGHISGMSSGGGVSGIHEGNGAISEQICRTLLIGEGSALTLRPELLEANPAAVVAVKNHL